MSAPTSFIVVRHEKVDNPQNIFYGVSRDLPISSQGMQDAQNLGIGLKRNNIELGAVVASNLIRTQMTAASILLGMGQGIEIDRRDGLKIQQDVRLTDVAYPAIEGQPIDSEGFVMLTSGQRVDLDNIEPYLNETLEHAGERFQASLKDIAKRYPGQTVLIVSHGDPIAAGLAKFEDTHTGIPPVALLIEQGRYPQKGELAVLQLDINGNLHGEIHRNPQMNEIPQLLDEGRMRFQKER